MNSTCLKPRLVTSPHSSLSFCSSLCFLLVKHNRNLGPSQVFFCFTSPPAAMAGPSQSHVEVGSMFLPATLSSLSFPVVPRPSSDAPPFSGQFQQLSDCLLPLLNSVGLLHCYFSCLSKPQTTFPHENVLEQLMVRQSALPRTAPSSSEPALPVSPPHLQTVFYTPLLLPHQTLTLPGDAKVSLIACHFV